MTEVREEVRSDCQNLNNVEQIILKAKRRGLNVLTTDDETERITIEGIAAQLP
jgi:hypothetical protein